MTHLDIVQKLIGETRPYGATHIDEARFENLKTLCNLVEGLIADIREVSDYKSRHEHSMKQMGEYADNFLKNL